MRADSSRKEQLEADLSQSEDIIRDLESESLKLAEDLGNLQQEKQELMDELCSENAALGDKNKELEESVKKLSMASMQPLQPVEPVAVTSLNQLLSLLEGDEETQKSSSREPQEEDELTVEHSASASAIVPDLAKLEKALQCAVSLKSDNEKLKTTNAELQQQLLDTPIEQLEQHLAEKADLEQKLQQVLIILQEVQAQLPLPGSETNDYTVTLDDLNANNPNNPDAEKGHATSTASAASELRKENESLKARVVQLQEALDESVTTLEPLNQQLTHRVTQVEHDNIASHEKHLGEKQALQAELLGVLGILQNLSVSGPSMEVLQQENTKLLSELQSLQSQLVEMQDHEVEMNEIKEQLEQGEKARAKTREETEATIAEFEEEMLAMQSDFETERETHLKQKTDLEQELKSVLATLHALQQQQEAQEPGSGVGNFTADNY